MIAAIKHHLVTASKLMPVAILLTGCASKDRPDRQSDCAKAKARYSSMRRSLKADKAAGMTSSFQIAIAEQRLRKAKADYISACGGRPGR